MKKVRAESKTGTNLARVTSRSCTSRGLLHEGQPEKNRRRLLSPEFNTNVSNS